MLFDPATRMRSRVEQFASAIIGSIILSPVAILEVAIISPMLVTPPFLRSRPIALWKGFCASEPRKRPLLWCARGVRWLSSAGECLDHACNMRRLAYEFD